MRTAQIWLIALGLVAFAVFVAACGQRPASSPSHFTPANQLPDPLSVLRSRKGDFLNSGTSGFEATLKSQRGFPVVVNRWASWCGPCRTEMPVLATAAERLSKSVAFVGVNYKDSQDLAKSFLAETPVPYPSFSDQDGSVSRVFTNSTFLPATAFYDADGNLKKVHFGPYQNTSDLIADIRKSTSS